MLLALVWLFVHTNPRDILSYKKNKTCTFCGTNKGILKCCKCGVQIMTDKEIEIQQMLMKLLRKTQNNLDDDIWAIIDRVEKQ